MRIPNQLSKLPAVATTVALLCLAGCGGRPYEVGKVEGVVLVNGKPASGVFVQFIPEVEGEASPPVSNGETDESGRFVLRVIEPNGASFEGAAVGPHRVVLRDLNATAPAAGRRQAVRIPVKCTMPAATPLTATVAAGEQTIEIEVPAR